MFLSNNTGTYTAIGSFNGTRYVRLTRKFNWKRENSVIEFYTTDYSRWVRQ